MYKIRHNGRGKSHLCDENSEKPLCGTRTSLNFLENSYLQKEGLIVKEFNLITKNYILLNQVELNCNYCISCLKIIKFK